MFTCSSTYYVKCIWISYSEHSYMNLCVRPSNVWINNMRKINKLKVFFIFWGYSVDIYVNLSEQFWVILYNFGFSVEINFIFWWENIEKQTVYTSADNLRLRLNFEKKKRLIRKENRQNYRIYVANFDIWIEVINIDERFIKISPENFYTHELFPLTF